MKIQRVLSIPGIVCLCVSLSIFFWQKLPLLLKLAGLSLAQDLLAGKVDLPQSNSRHFSHTMK